MANIIFSPLKDELSPRDIQLCTRCTREMCETEKNVAPPIIEVPDLKVTDIPPSTLLSIFYTWDVHSS